ncbi:MAG: putative bifunctional diguanylate cyclase/phosphodiesterase [Gemmatimonadota bacterium]
MVVSPVLLHSTAGVVVLALLVVLIVAWWRAIRRTDISPIEALFDMNFEAVLMLDPEGRIRRANPHFLELARATHDEVEGRPLLNFVTGWSQKRLVTGLREARGGSRETIEIGIARAGGHVDARMTCGPHYHRRRVVGLWGLLRDITEQKEAERELEDRALHDFLTGLPNRALFHDRLEHAVQRSRRGGAEIALLYLDLDGFKPVNDTAGHAAGDEVLREVAHRLVAIARAGDTVGRIGGDEFGVLLETAASPKEAMGVAGRILSRIQQPITVDGVDLQVGASIGIAMSDDEARDTEELVRRADLAMYEAKRRGGAQRYMYCRELEREALDLGDRIEADLSAAIERDELYLEYQPIVDVSGKSFVGVEALVRWEHPEFGAVFPSVFIPVAERSSLIVALDRWVLDRACFEMRQHVAGGHAALMLSVNLSERHFDEPDFVEAVSGILGRHEMDAGRVQLEITEAVAGRARDTVQRLKGLGLRIAIDRFGTGYSSLAYLRDLDVDVLKVDRSFALSLGADPASVAIVRTILTLAEMLDVEVIIEGVEDAAQLGRLEALGGRYVQGYMFGRPVAASSLSDVLAAGPVFRPPDDDRLPTDYDRLPGVVEPRSRRSLRPPAGRPSPDVATASWMPSDMNS